jgi:hypothetical protein
MAFRVDQRVQFSATATATLLIVDAWFDVTTSVGRGQLFEALLLAICVEIPAAVFSIYVARSVNRRSLELARQGGPGPDSPGTAVGRVSRRRRGAGPDAGG